LGWWRCVNFLPVTTNSDTTTATFSEQSHQLWRWATSNAAAPRVVTGPDAVTYHNLHVRLLAAADAETAGAYHPCIVFPSGDLFNGVVALNYLRSGGQYGCRR
jgi:hypothetical protein